MTTALASPLDRLVTLPEGVPELTLGWGVAQWAMTYLRQPNGTHAGQPFRPVDSQIRFWLWWYGVDEDGNWLFDHAVRRLAKGSGKSPFAAVQALAELCGPVRLADFDPSVPGGCVGKRVDMPLVQIVATNEQQTANTMRMVRAFASKKSRLVAEYGIDPGKEKYFLPPEGTLEQRTSSASGAEGSETSFTCWMRRSTGNPATAALGSCRRWRITPRSRAPGCWRPATLGCRGKIRCRSRRLMPGSRRRRPGQGRRGPDPVRCAADSRRHRLGRRGIAP